MTTCYDDVDPDGGHWLTFCVDVKMQGLVQHIMESNSSLFQPRTFTRGKKGNMLSSILYPSTHDTHKQQVLLAFIR